MFACDTRWCENTKHELERQFVVALVRCYIKVTDVHTEKTSCVSADGEYLACLHYILQDSFRQLNDRLGQSQNSRDKLPNSSLQEDNRVGED